MNARAIGVGVMIAVLYVLGALFIDADLVPTVLGGVLAGVLAVLILRDIEQRRRQRERQQGGR